jgi:BASS family bile acid:Na+ symporter
MVSIFAFMFSRGLMTRLADLGYFGARPGLLLRSLFSVDILVPLVAMAVVVLVRPAQATAIGLLLLASSPAAPLVLKKISKAGGKPEYAVSLHIVLASLALITTPVTLELLSGATKFQLGVSPLGVAEQVGISILVPILAGMAIRWLFPALARRMTHPIEAISNIILMLVIFIVLLSTYHLLLALDIRSYVAIALMIVGALVGGHLLASGRRDERTTLALESATRNVGLALLIAADFASLEKALPVLIPYIIMASIMGFFYVRYQKIRGGTARRVGPD